MAKFMDVHHGMKGITAEQLSAAHKAGQAIAPGAGDSPGPSPAVR